MSINPTVPSAFPNVIRTTMDSDERPNAKLRSNPENMHIRPIPRQMSISATNVADANSYVDNGLAVVQRTSSMLGPASSTAAPIAGMKYGIWIFIIIERSNRKYFLS